MNATAMTHRFAFWLAVCGTTGCVTTAASPALPSVVSEKLPARTATATLASGQSVSYSQIRQVGFTTTVDETGKIESFHCVLQTDAQLADSDPRVYSTKPTVGTDTGTIITNNETQQIAATDSSDPAAILAKCRLWADDQASQVDGEMAKRISRWNETPEDAPCMEYAADSRCEALAASIDLPHGTAMRCINVRTADKKTRLTCRIRSAENTPCPVDGSSNIGTWICDRGLKCNRYAHDNPPFRQFTGQCRKR